MRHVTAEEAARLSVLDPRAEPGLHPTWLEGPHNDDRLDVGVITVSPGVVTPPHVHLGGQVIVVTDGHGFVECEGQRVELSAGDVLICQPGELHSHGAVDDASFSHLTVTTGGYTFPGDDPR